VRLRLRYAVGGKVHETVSVGETVVAAHTRRFVGIWSGIGSNSASPH
jgi:hypothetical protein